MAATSACKINCTTIVLEKNVVQVWIEFAVHTLYDTGKRALWFIPKYYKNVQWVIMIQNGAINHDLMHQSM